MYDVSMIWNIKYKIRFLYSFSHNFHNSLQRVGVGGGQGEKIDIMMKLI